MDDHQFPRLLNYMSQFFNMSFVVYNEIMSRDTVENLKWNPFKSE
jgi:hypothetical protein